MRNSTNAAQNQHSFSEAKQADFCKRTRDEIEKMLTNADIVTRTCVRMLGNVGFEPQAKRWKPQKTLVPGITKHNGCLQVVQKSLVPNWSIKLNVGT